MKQHLPGVLILGAGGRLGHACVQAFSTAGWRVRAHTRSHKGLLPEGVERVQADAFDRDAICRLAAGADVIVNALSPLYTHWEEEARFLASNAIAAARSAGALLLCPGNVYNFGTVLPPNLRLDTPSIADTAKAAIRIDIERELVAAVADGVNSVVVRAGDFFGGKGRGVWFDRVITASLDKGRLVYPGPFNLPHAWAYLPDFAQTLVLLANRRAQLQGAHCFHFTGHAFSGAQLQTEVQQLLQRPVSLRMMQWSLVHLLAPFSPMMRATVAMRYLWQRPHRLEGGELAEFLGELPHTPLRKALRASLGELGISVPAPEMAY